MRFSIKRLTLLAITVVVIGLLLPEKSFATEKDWATMQALGGFRIGQPQRTEHGWELPADVDVTGMHAITVQPTKTDPSAACVGVDVEYDKKNIYLAVYAGVSLLHVKSGACPPAVLGNPAPGTYTVYYKGLDETPVKLGEISVVHHFES